MLTPYLPYPASKEPHCVKMFLHNLLRKRKRPRAVRIRFEPKRRFFSLCNSSICFSLSKMASVSGGCLRLRLRHLFWGVSQFVQFRRNRLGCGQFVGMIAFLRNQLTAHLRCRQSRVQTVRAKLRISLTLPLYQSSDIVQQVGQMLFTALAAQRVSKSGRAITS